MMKSRLLVVLLLVGLVTGCGTVTDTPVAARPSPTHILAPRSTPTTTTPNSSITGAVPGSTLYMMSATTGWTSSAQHVWWSHSSGHHWINITPPKLPRGATLVFRPLSANVAWAAVTTDITNAPPFSAYVTTNHGRSWVRTTPRAQDGIAFLSAFSAHSAQIATGMVGAMGSESMVIQLTRDAGRTWRVLPSSITPTMAGRGQTHVRGGIPYYGDKTGMAWSSPSTGWVSGEQGGHAVLYQTVNGGTTWQSVAIPFRSGQVIDAAFPPEFFNREQGIMAVQINNQSFAVASTQNGGQSWTLGDTLSWPWQAGDSLWSFCSSADGVALQIIKRPSGRVAAAHLDMTSNGGQTWSQITANLPLERVTSIDMVTPSLIFAVTGRGTTSSLWKSTDGGQDWRS